MKGPLSIKGRLLKELIIHRRNLKIFFSRTSGLISTKLSTMHLCVKESQVCSNEGPRPFPRGDNYEITKIH